MIPLDVVIVLTTLIFYKEFIAMSYDEEFSFVVGIPVKPLYFALLCMTALSVVMVIRVVGLILVIALMTIPPYIAEKYTSSLAKMMILSSFLGIVFTFAGLWFSYNYDFTSGATIIIVAGIAFFISQLVDLIRGHTF
jgi:zinc transport system permease protein